MPALARLLRRLAALATIACLVAPVAPASADRDPLGLSWDGRTWATSLDGTLFGRPGTVRRWVPGDSDTRSFHVRNRSGDPATLRIDYRLPPGELAEPGNLSLAVSVGGRAWQPLAPAGGWVLVATGPLGSGDSTRVDVRGVFDWSSTNQSQDLVLPVDLRVRLAGIAAGTAAGEEGGAGAAAADGGLADTGAPELRWAAGLGALCLCGGLLIVATRRKEQRRC